AAAEAREQALVEVVDLRRRTVAREHDLPSARREQIPRAQQLLLRTATARQELHVVEQQQVGVAEPVAERVALTRLDRAHHTLEQVRERLVHDRQVRV